MTANPLDPTPAVVARVRQYRKARSLSTQELSDALAEHGCHMHRSTLAGLEHGRRPTLRLGELYALAHVLDVPVGVLLHGTVCGTCNGAPPAGFACLECGEKHTGGDQA